jgi:hypothetical protein
MGVQIPCPPFVFYIDFPKESKSKMQPLFMDESGDLGFGCGTDYFLLAFIAPKVGKHLNKLIKNFNAHLINKGWNPAVEIKATNVLHAGKSADIPETYAYKKCPQVPLKHVLESIANLDCYIEYVVIKLDTVSSGLKTAHSAILYNYFSWLLLKGPLCYFPAVELFADRRNRENHNLLKFDGYIESKAGIERAEKGKDPLNPLLIHHYHSNSVNECKGAERAQVEYGVRGLEAADFVCWAIKKKYENGDKTWYSMIEKKMKWSQKLYGF